MPNEPTFSIKTWALDASDRVVSTLIQSAIMFVLANSQGNGMVTWKPLLAAVFPAVATVLIAIATAKLPALTNYWLDVTFRIFRTFAATFFGGLAADGVDLFSVTSWRTAFIAGASAILVIVKGEIAKRLAKAKGTTDDLVTPASFAKAP